MNSFNFNFGNQALDDIVNKVWRADHHFKSFDAAVAPWRQATNPAPNPLRVDFQPGRTYFEIQTSLVEIPREASLLLGDALYQMRSALDHIVSYLVFKKTQSREAMKRAQFPIFRQESEFLNFGKHKSVKFLADTFGNPSPEFTAIQESQPYEGHNPFRRDGLWHLHGLNNIDKHRTVLVVYNGFSFGAIVWPEDGHGCSEFCYPMQTVRPGTQRLDFPWHTAAPPARVHLDNVNPYVVLTETDGLCDNRPTNHVWMYIRLDVVAAVNRFAPFFDGTNNDSLRHLDIVLRHAR